MAPAAAGSSGSVEPPTRVGPEPTHAEVASSSSSSSCSGSSSAPSGMTGTVFPPVEGLGPETSGCVLARRAGASPTSGDDSSTIGCPSVGRRCLGASPTLGDDSSTTGCASVGRRTREEKSTGTGEGTGAGPSTSVSTESARSMSSAVGFSKSALGAGAGRSAFMPVVERGRPNAPELSDATPVGAADSPARGAPGLAARVPKGSEPTAGAVVRGCAPATGPEPEPVEAAARGCAPTGPEPVAGAAARGCAPSGERPPTRGGPVTAACAARAAAGSSAENVLDGRRTAIPPAGPGLEGAPACSRRVFSARIFSSTGWLAAVSLSKRTPMPGVTPARVGSFSRIQTIVPSPASSGAASCSWKSKRSCVPTGSGSRVRMKMPPRLTSTAYRSMNWSRLALRNLIRKLTGPRGSFEVG